MSAPLIQANLGDLDTLSRRLNSCANDVADLKANLSALLTGTDWQGGAATRVRDAWDSQFRPALDDMSGALDDMSTEVNNRRMRLDAAGN